MMADWGPFSLSGKTAIVTGGSQGIGWGVVSRFVEAGANVVVADLDPAKAMGKAEKSGISESVAAVRTDVTDDAAADETVRAAVGAFGQVDVLVNNAGIYPSDPFLTTSRRRFSQILDINLVSVAMMSQAVARHLVERRAPGRIVNIASVNGTHPDVGMTAYDASKAGVIMLTKTMGIELAPHGIQVSAIAPGWVGTEGSGAVSEDGESLADDQAFIDESIPLRRLGKPDDIATAAVFLASPAASYITGSTLIVDGGRLLL